MVLGDQPEQFVAHAAAGEQGLVAGRAEAEPGPALTESVGIGADRPAPRPACP